ncbi:MAG: 7-cyano-7-deazaguanine synthase, partial [Candidatus Omnitrophica bacterium CG12_big_fil_rev_8_21_14_0_65_45_16]
MPDLKAICLLSGGLDSATVLAIAKADGCEVITLTVHYGQLHAKEIESAKTIARYYDVENIYVEVPFQWGGSALTDKTIELPKDRDEATMAQDIPVSYVPARNTVFLSLAASVAEARGAERIYIGANAVDYSGYPDCRPEYFDAFQKMIQQGTKSGVGGCG